MPPKHATAPIWWVIVEDIHRVYVPHCIVIRCEVSEMKHNYWFLDCSHLHVHILVKNEDFPMGGRNDRSASTIIRWLCSTTAAAVQDQLKLYQTVQPLNHAMITFFLPWSLHCIIHLFLFFAASIMNNNNNNNEISHGGTNKVSLMAKESQDKAIVIATTRTLMNLEYLPYSKIHNLLSRVFHFHTALTKYYLICACVWMPAMVFPATQNYISLLIGLDFMSRISFL